MMKARIIPTLFLLLSSFSSIAAGYDMNGNCLQAYDMVLRLRFEEANQLLNQEKKANPQNNLRIYLENYQDFLKLIITEEEPLFEELSAKRKTRLTTLDGGDKKSPWHLYVQAQVNLQWAFARLKFGEYTTAAAELNRAYRLLNQNQELFPEFSPNQALLGLMHILIGSIPDRYRWIAQTLSLHGSYTQGLSTLKNLLNDKEVIERYPFLHAEVIFLMSFVTSNFSPFPDESAGMLRLLENTQTQEMIPGSPLLIYASAAFYMQQGSNDKALQLLSLRPRDSRYFPFHYLEYLTGVSKLNKLDPGARLHFLRFVTNFRGRNFIKSAYQHLAWIELINNNREGYLSYLKSASLRGFSDIDSDKQAQLEANRQTATSVILLKARLLTDGGYYSEALAEMKNTGLTILDTPCEKTEYTYRLARIHHKSGNTEEALSYYKKTLDRGKTLSCYFAANSALQLGNLYRIKGDRKTAAAYYNLCLDLEFDEYRNSIHQKARAGLSALKN